MGRVGRFDFKDWDHLKRWRLPFTPIGTPGCNVGFMEILLLRASCSTLKRTKQDGTGSACRRKPSNIFPAPVRELSEYGVMQQVLVSQANQRLHRLIKDAAPDQLTINDMEGCEFAISLLNVLVPELVTADAIWLECYNWEGMRGSHDTNPRHQTWLVEPSAEKPTIELIGNAGYVQMLIRWMQQSGQSSHPLPRHRHRQPSWRANENEQALMVDRFNAYIQACGAHSIKLLVLDR